LSGRERAPWISSEDQPLNSKWDGQCLALIGRGLAMEGNRTDILIIGSGIAGLTAALDAAKTHKVVVVTKAALIESNTVRAQGGIAAVVGADDDFDSHVADTLGAGAGLCNVDIVKTCVENGPEMIRWLMELGVAFSREAQEGGAPLDLGREGGHSRRRIVHSMDRTGLRVEESLAAAVSAHPDITILENTLAVELITLNRLGAAAQEDRCLGCYLLDTASGSITTLAADATILATGGAGKVYLYTSNPDVATGDGVAMAWRAGAAISNMEFFQFHPTCLYHPGAKNFLISEAVRGEGGQLKDRSGRRFMQDYTPKGELDSRDVVARAIDSELKRSGDDCVFLDISHKPEGFVERRFPQIVETCRTFGIDPVQEPIPVVPAAHYQCGGVRTDEWGWTGIPGLYAVGEVACTGMHGANRLASNSLLEALVMGRRSAADAIKWLRRGELPAVPLPEWHTGFARHPDESVVISQNWDEIRRVMWNYVGVVRSDNRLARARKRIAMVREEIQADYWRFILTPDLVELRNLADVAHLIVEMASMRKESRGLHYNMDYPAVDNEHWQRESILKQAAKRR